MLRILPLMFEVIPEAEELGLAFRHIILGNYRIIYQVQSNRVNIIRIIHAARLLTRAMLDHEPPQDLPS